MVVRVRTLFLFRDRHPLCRGFGVDASEQSHQLFFAWSSFLFRSSSILMIIDISRELTKSAPFKSFLEKPISNVRSQLRGPNQKFHIGSDFMISGTDLQPGPAVMRTEAI